MRLIDDSPLRAGWLPWQFGPGDWRLIVAVKATLELPRDGYATLATEQAFVTGDEFWDDDPERSIRYSNDLALLKPQGEVWVTGTLRSTTPVRELACMARVGELSTRFDVVGDRWWRPDGGMTEPVEFTEMPICWERCFGGPGYEHNPVGRGIAPDPEDPEGRVALPNIERHGRLVRSPEERPVRVGPCPIPPTWSERMRLTGTYDAAYMRDRWPFFAEDFSWRYFQTAPESQRIEGYWRGDEEIELSRLHPEHTFVRCRLPGLKPRAFLHASGAQGALSEVGLVLDTVAIDAGEGRAFLIWRGSAPLQDDSLDDLAHLYLMHEGLGAPKTQREYESAFATRLRALWEEDQGFEAEPIPEDEALGAPPRAPEPPLVIAEPDPVAPSSAEEAIAAQRARARELGWPESLIEQLYPTTSGATVATTPTTRASLEAARAAAVELGIPTAGVDAALAQIDEELPAPPESTTPEVRPPEGLWTSQERRDLVVKCLAVGEPLTQLDLSDADLSLLDLSGQDLSGALLLRANLQGANLDEATLDGATLDGAKLDGATLRRTSLRGAMLSLVEGEGVDLTGAVLEDALAERAVLPGVVLREARARGLVLVEGFLPGADFESADLRDAELARTNFDEASFRRARMTDARIEGASLRCACLDEIDAEQLRASNTTDLSEATMRWASLARSSFSESLLIGTKLAESDLTRATFTGARLEGAQLLAIRACGANFSTSVLIAASLSGSDLLGARFEAAQMRLADLTNANLYQAELYRADLTDALLDGANVEGTKLA
ncbi:MAG: DUF2169 domain-containing protein [Myxococcales bacterium]|nr:DUF2169 domain-containing protein [Myxococcales bacterium]